MIVWLSMYSKLFADTFGKSSLEILTEYSTPEEFLNVDTNALAETLSLYWKWSNN